MTKILEGEILPPEKPERPVPERSDRADSVTYMLMARQQGKTMAQEMLQAYRRKPPRPVN